MSENIKEIINDLQRVADRKCYPEDILCGSIAQEWTDYITDLYEENERLNNIIKTKDEGIKAFTEDLCDTTKELEKAYERIKGLEVASSKLNYEATIYANRIDKAREYIKEKYDYLLKDETFLDHDERIDSKQIKHILEILDKMIPKGEDNK